MKTKTTTSEKIQEFKALQNSYEKLNKAHDFLLDMYLNSDLSNGDVEIHDLLKVIENEMAEITKKVTAISKSL